MQWVSASRIVGWLLPFGCTLTMVPVPAAAAGLRLYDAVTGPDVFAAAPAVLPIAGAATPGVCWHSS